MAARILSLDKMLDDLRGAAAQETAKQGFNQGFQQGKVDAAKAEASKLAQATSQAQEAHKGGGSFDDAHPGVATSYLTDQGKEKMAEGSDGLGKKSPSYRSHGNGPAPLPSDYDEQAQSYFKTLSDMDKMEQGGPGESRPDLAGLDAAYRAQGGQPTLPGTAPPPQGAPPPAGGYGGPPSAAAPPAPAAGGGTAGLTPEMLAALDAAAHNPNAAVGR